MELQLEIAQKAEAEAFRQMERMEATITTLRMSQSTPQPDAQAGVLKSRIKEAEEAEQKAQAQLSAAQEKQQAQAQAQATLRSQCAILEATLASELAAQAALSAEVEDVRRKEISLKADAKAAQVAEQTAVAQLAAMRKEVGQVDAQLRSQFAAQQRKMVPESSAQKKRAADLTGIQVQSQAQAAVITALKAQVASAENNTSTAVRKLGTAQTAATASGKEIVGLKKQLAELRTRYNGLEARQQQHVLAGQRSPVRSPVRSASPSLRSSGSPSKAASPRKSAIL